VSDAFSPAARALVEAMGTAPRGPRRDGCFAVWLTVRLVEDLRLDPPLAERALRRRADLLLGRLSSLSLSPALRRALTATLRALEEPAGRDPARLLAQLAAPVRDALGAEPGDALARAARTGR
jgi:hypothetical protein